MTTDDNSNRNLPNLRPIDPEAWFSLQTAIMRSDLPSPAREWLRDLVETVNRCEDPRPAVDKMPRKQRDEQTAIIGMHYWALRAKYGSGSALSAQRKVAEHWGKNEENVKTIGRRTRAFENHLKPGATLDTLIETLETEASTSTGQK